MSKVTREMFIQATGREPERDDLDRCNCPDAGKTCHDQCGWSVKHNKPNFMVPYNDVLMERAQTKTERIQWDVKQTDKDTLTLTPRPPVWAPKYGHSIVIQGSGVEIFFKDDRVYGTNTVEQAVNWVKAQEASIDFENAKPTGYIAKKHPKYDIWHIRAPDGTKLVTVGDQISADNILKHLNR